MRKIQPKNYTKFKKLKYEWTDKKNTYFNIGS